MGNFLFYVGLIRSSVIFSIFQRCQETRELLNIMLIFDRCHRSSAARAPVKYTRDSKNLRGTFARSKILLAEKLTNGALVTPTPRCDRRWILGESFLAKCSIYLYMHLWCGSWLLKIIEFGFIPLHDKVLSILKARHFGERKHSLLFIKSVCSNSFQVSELKQIGVANGDKAHFVFDIQVDSRNNF